MPKRDYQFWVYILSNRSHILYVGLTNHIHRRVWEHRQLKPGTFTAKYKITRLVYAEYHQYINTAIRREKELKRWTRAQKIALIESVNPTWEDLLPESKLQLQAAETQIPFGDDKQKNDPSARSQLNENNA